MKENGILGTLIPTFGFEPDAAYLAGLYPDECDGGMHFYFSPESSPFNIARILPGCIDNSPEVVQLMIRRLLKLYVKHASKFSRIKYVSHSCRIPFKLLPYFDIAEKHLFTEDSFANGRSIFSIIKKKSKSFFCHSAPTHSTDSDAVLVDLEKADHPFDYIYIHIGDLDQVGHKYGPHSAEMLSALQKVDSKVERMWGYLDNKYEDFNFIIFGDHGMVEVKELLDFREIIKTVNLKLFKDYIYFLDSTLARFWCFNEKAKDLIESELNEIEKGSVLSIEDKQKYHINYPHNKFGDIIFLADPGVLIFPNYWNNSMPEKGMHGYAPEYYGQQSAVIISSQKSLATNNNGPLDMRRLYPTFLKLMGIENNHSALKSIV